MELNEFHDVFRDYAESLSLKDRSEVLAALEGKKPIHVFRVLEALREAGRLPADAEKILTDFFWEFCY